MFGGNVYPSSCLNLGLMEYCFYSFAKVVRIYQLSNKCLTASASNISSISAGCSRSRRGTPSEYCQSCGGEGSKKPCRFYTVLFPTFSMKRRSRKIRGTRLAEDFLGFYFKYLWIKSLIVSSALSSPTSPISLL